MSSSVRFLLFIYLILELAFANNALAQIGDRIVIAINNIPYTQLQIERYINVKEALRDNIKSSQPLKASNWSEAIEAFSRDMMIHQDATKSSGFRPTKEAIARMRLKSEKSIQDAPAFKAAFERLHLDKINLETEILKIITVENYRRGKKSLNIDSKNATDQWEQELINRSVVRYFEDAKQYKELSAAP